MRPTDFDVLSIFDAARPAPSVRFVHDMLVHKGFYGREPFTTAYKNTLRILKQHDRIKQDPRRTYTIAELSNLMLMSPAQRAAFAERTGRSMRAVYAAVDRHRKALDKVTRSDNQITTANTFISSSGYFNFANPAHLQLLNITSKQMRAAQKYLRSEGLYLRNPNYLYNQADGLLMQLTDTMQLHIVKHPVDFVNKTLPSMEDKWEAVRLDPAQDAEFEVPEDLIDLGLSRPRRGTARARASRVQEQFVKTANKLTRNMQSIGPVPKESDMYIRAVELQRVLAAWLAQPIEVLTDVEYRKIGTYDADGKIITSARFAAENREYVLNSKCVPDYMKYAAQNLRPEDFEEETMTSPSTTQSTPTPVDPETIELPEDQTDYDTNFDTDPDHNAQTTSTPVDISDISDLSSFFAAAEALNNGTLEDDEDEETTAPAPDTPTTPLHNFALDLGL